MRDETPWTTVGPDTPGGRYLRHSWQPVYRACDLRPGAAVRLEVLGQRFTLWRGRGGAAGLLQDRCPHRNTALSLGSVEGESLRCMHHGWRFGADGACLERPGERGDGGVCARSYPVVEALGLLFIWLGEGAPPPPPDFPAWRAPGALRVLPPEVWPCGFFQRLENSCDINHLPYAHAASGLAAMLGGMPEVSCEETAWGMVVRARAPNPAFPAPEIHWLAPNALVFKTPISEAAGWRDHLVYRVPLADHRCVSFSVALVPDSVPGWEGYRMDSPLSDPFAPSVVARAGEAVLAGQSRLTDPGIRNLTEVEDYVELVGQGTPDEQGPETLGRMDAPIALMRRIWRREVAASEAGAGLTAWATFPGVGPGGPPR